MLVHAGEVARACVAATSLRRQHPDWFQWLFIHDALPAPWEDFAAGVFDATMATTALPQSATRPTQARRAAKQTWRNAALLERAFALPFEAGADVAICLDAHHVWMRPWPALRAALETHDVVMSDAQLIAVRRGANLERLREALDRAHPCSEPVRATPAHDFFVLDDAAFGFDHTRLERLPLRFALDGSLRQGDLPIISVNFRESATSEAEARCSLPAYGTEWIELTKWYADQLRRFGDNHGAADQLRRSSQTE